jgi:putative hydrolase of the HAD superfamily
MRNTIRIIAFDADDTLWENEKYFKEAEEQFCTLLSSFLPRQFVSRELYKTEMNNLDFYGFGIKSFILSMIETITKISGGMDDLHLIEKTIELGKDLLKKPIVLLSGVQKTVKQLHENYKLVVATKGDLLDQERKLQKSGLLEYFHHVEIMSDKRKENYEKLLKDLNCHPESFLMLGNSINSDILPVLELGAFAAHIPHHTTWAYEQQNDSPDHPHFLPLKNIDDIINHLN